MTPYERYVQALTDLAAEARGFPLGGFSDYACSAPRPDAPVALIFSPHPDDEVIIGGWPLRLLRQSGWRVVNVAVTHGSNRQRQAARWAELEACCRCIGFDLVTPAPNGLDGVNPKVRAADAERWARHVATVRDVLAAHAPRAVFFPHERDWNTTHIGTHHLVAEALAALPASFRCAAIETEFWAQMSTPNLLVESAPADVGALVTALSAHVGEVQRNPYHLTLPAWMMDNVRRGGEWVGGQGQTAPAFPFGTLYRLRTFAAGRFEPVAVSGGFLSAEDDPAALL